MQNRIIKEQQLDRKIELLSIINQLTAGPKNMVQKEKLFLIAKEKGFSEEEIDFLLDKLIEEGIVYEPMEGNIKKR